MSFLLNDKQIVVNYHYIQNPTRNNEGMNPCAISEFEKHIDFLSKHYKPASLVETFEAGKNNSNERYYSITFDDGLKDQYENAVPILEKYGCKATFFIITETLEGTLPSAHKFHIILSRISTSEAIDLWNGFLKEKHPKYANRFFISKDERTVKDRRLYADIPTANIKEMFTTVSTIVRDEFLDFVFDKYHLKEEEFANKMFLDESEIVVLDKKKFGIGMHTHVHEPIEVIGRKGLHNDFKKSKKKMQKILGREPMFFSYPYGLIPSWGEAEIEKEGITHAVTVEERPIMTGDSPLLIPRYDMITLREFLASH